MTTLTDFLLARIGEDEAVAQAPDPSASPEVLTDMSRIEYDYGPVGYARLGIGRVLAECQAKRRVIDAAWECQEMLDIEYHLRDRSELEAAGDHPATLRHLAQVYADHPDYDPSWTISE